MPRFINIKDIPDKLRKPHIGRYRRMLRDALANPALTDEQRATLRVRLNALGSQKPYDTLRATREARTTALVAGTIPPAGRSDASEVQPEAVSTTDTANDDLLDLSKDELLTLAGNEGVAVKRFWTKARIAEAVRANRT